MIKTAIVTVGIEVERQHDKSWRPLKCRMFWCKQKSDPYLIEWAREEVDLLGNAILPGTKNMRVGERRRFWVRMLMSSYHCYWDDELSSEVQILKAKRAK